MTRTAVPALLVACLLPSCRAEVDCSQVSCERPVACCAGTCSAGFNIEPPPVTRLEDCCTCRGRAHADDCPPSTRCFREWQLKGRR